jgi:hypothetical protein
LRGANLIQDTQFDDPIFFSRGGLQMIRYSTLLLIAVISTIGIKHTAMECNVRASQSVVTNSQAAHSGVIDGADEPERISDYVAYSVFFKFIANRPSSAQSALRAYLRGLQFYDETNIDVVFSAAADFCSRTRPIDLQLKEPQKYDVMALRTKKEVIYSEVLDSLNKSLGPAEAAKVFTHIQKMKRRMKMYVSQ